MGHKLGFVGSNEKHLKKLLLELKLGNEKGGKLNRKIGYLVWGRGKFRVECILNV